MTARACLFAAISMALVTQATAGELAAGDTLLAVYIDLNLAQARRDSQPVKYKVRLPISHASLRNVMGSR